jgi:hypothetical protein
MSFIYQPLYPFTGMEALNERIELKKKLRTACLQSQQQLADTAKAAMLQAQESANEEKGSMEDKFESFREQCQIDRDMYAKQLQEITSGLQMLLKMDISREYDTVMLGSVVVTDAPQRMFIAIGLGEVKMDGHSYFAISTSSPLFKAMAGKKQGDTFAFRDKSFRLMAVF